MLDLKHYSCYSNHQIKHEVSVKEPEPEGKYMTVYSKINLKCSLINKVLIIDKFQTGI